MVQHVVVWWIQIPHSLGSRGHQQLQSNPPLAQCLDKRVDANAYASTTTMTAARSAEVVAAPLGLLMSVWSSGLWRFLPFVFIYMIGLATLYPTVPTIVTNAFASESAGTSVDCQMYTPETSPRWCVEAHSKAVTMSAWTSFVSGSILSFLFSPVVGHLSDRYGRKPFMMAGLVIGLVPMVTLMVNQWGWIPIIWYYPAQALNGISSSINLSLTAVADLVRQEHRAASVAGITGMFSLALIIGPTLGGYLQPLQSVYLCMALTLVSAVYVVLVLPESAPGVCKTRAAATAATSPTVSVGGAAPSSQHPPAPPHVRTSHLASLSSGWHVIMRSNWYIRLAIIWGLISAMTNGAMDVLIQYLQLTLGFHTSDQAHVFVVIAVVGLTVKIVVLGFVIQHIGDQWVMGLGLLAYLAEFLMLATVTTKAAAMASVGVGALAAVVWPASIALQSSRASPDEWGAVAGALQALGALAGGLGPVLFAQVFAAFTHEPVPDEEPAPGALPYMPQMVWYIAAGLAALAILLTATLHLGDGQRQQQQRQGKQAGTEAGAGGGQGEEAEGLLGTGGKAAKEGAGKKVDVWVLGRAMSLKSSLDRLGSFANKAAAEGGEDNARGTGGAAGARGRFPRGGSGRRAEVPPALGEEEEGELEQPLLPPEGDVELGDVNEGESEGGGGQVRGGL